MIKYYVTNNEELVTCDSKEEVWDAVEVLQSEMPKSRWDEIEVYSVKDHAPVELVDLEAHGEPEDTDEPKGPNYGFIYGAMGRG
jgi:hypothetical protein